ncbi:MarR family winged helix-turn-helix transcriptional regulator [Pseudarthrobacter sp. IC2-21]|jgi:DNA-binding MarR family transcriptional regulator|uniref:MarR family winged helix-turn-helix transcriptional regulator n=1 Tax=Pseudarthrobacter sp. IC2-21 TaxID=3092262 RepID=UPI002A6A04E5|nr:MarR family transcriptional regulator [Pseudarthrobacter sp. IC2-21]
MLSSEATAEENAGLIRALRGILAQWTAPEFITAVARREDLHFDPGALKILTILNSFGAQRPSALASRMVTGASNISKITTRLAQARMVERTSDPRDSRATLIGLTESGRRAAISLERSGNSLVVDLLGSWSPADRNELLRLLTRFEIESHRVAALMTVGTATGLKSLNG